MAASLQTNVETLTTRADDTLVAFESMASSLDREITVTSKDARELIASLQPTAGNLDGATDTLEAMLPDNREPIRDFTTTGLSELRTYLTRVHALLVGLTRANTHTIGRAPLREYVGQHISTSVITVP